MLQEAVGLVDVYGRQGRTTLSSLKKINAIIISVEYCVFKSESSKVLVTGNRRKGAQ
jgi:hypothetical protein